MVINQFIQTDCIWTLLTRLTMTQFNSTEVFPSNWRDIGHIAAHTLSTQGPGVLLGALFFFLFFNYTRRIYFHPLSTIPGPRLAAATHLYEAYYNILRQGLSKHVIGLHERYSLYFLNLTLEINLSIADSPVIRIGTNRVHVGDPSYYHTYVNFRTRLRQDVN